MACFGLNSCVFLALPYSVWAKWVAWLLLACAAFAPLLLPRAIKRFITWPRTGYVAYKHDRKFWTAIVASILVAGGLGIFLPLLLKPDIGRITPAEHGAMSRIVVVVRAIFLVSNALLYLRMTAGTIRQHRWKWVLWVVMILGSIAICFTAGANFLDLMRPLLLFFGLIWGISGGATLYSYLRHTQAPASEAE